MACYCETVTYHNERAESHENPAETEGPTSVFCYGSLWPVRVSACFCKPLVGSSNLSPGTIRQEASARGSWRRKRPYCFGMPARSISAAHLAISASSRALSSSGVLALASIPSSA